jgi:hypothetical protein
MSITSYSDSPVPVSSDSLYRSFTSSKGKVYLLYGQSPIYKMSLMMAANIVSGGSKVTVVDGCNRFNVHFLARYARRHKIDTHDFLQKIYISRGFTCYQIEATMNNRLPIFLKHIDSRTALIFGLLDTFYDEQVKFDEAEQILKRVLSTLAIMKDQGINILLACTEWNVIPKERNRLFASLKANSDRVFHLILNEEQKPKLFLEDKAALIKG